MRRHRIAHLARDVAEAGRWRAVCACGWAASGADPDELEALADRHAREGNRPTEPPLRVSGFVSGLPD